MENAMLLEITLPFRASRRKQGICGCGSKRAPGWDEQRSGVAWIHRVRGSRREQKKQETDRGRGQAGLLLQPKEMQSRGYFHGSSCEYSPASYEKAMEALSSLISRRKRGDGSNRGSKFDLMFKYMKILDLEEHIDGLNIIHIAGTKGKGSTCIFCESILRECGFRTGLFTSPHLVDLSYMNLQFSSILIMEFTISSLDYVNNFLK
ncbi:hypothetical protein Taro_021626, partial [Colocasia esculenta]|nr:hypothetical protein [Colocasia esculenta]